MKEAIKTNEVYNIQNRKLVEWGYSLLDDMIKDYETQKANDTNTILIAPSWQKDNIVDLCLEEMLDNLGNSNYEIVVRPHPQHVRHKKEMFEKLKEILVDELQIEEELITPDAELTNDLGINSIELADLVMLCEDKFNIEINDDNIGNFVTIGDVVEYLEGLQK